MIFSSEENEKAIKEINIRRQQIVDRLNNLEYYGDFSREDLEIIVGDLIDYIDELENDYEFDDRDVFDFNDSKLYKMSEIVGSNIIRSVLDE